MANALEQEISTSLSIMKDTWYMKIPDSGSNRYVSRPFDHIAIIDGSIIAIECKQTRISTSFPLSNIRSHQIVSMAMAESSGAKSYLLINIRDTKSSPRVNELYALNVDQVIHWYYQQSDRASIPVSWLEGHAVKLERLKVKQGKYGWRLRSLVQD